MTQRLLTIFVVFGFFIHFAEAMPLKQLPSGKRELEAYRISEPIDIDGKLSESVWQRAMLATNFYQYEPFNGSFPSEKSEVRVLYDNDAVYIGAKLFDDEPDEIFRELGKRDNSDNLKADAFSVLISPYNDGINYLEFIVSSSGVQTDILRTGNSTDRSWDAVWESAVTITDEGWFVEMRIPFSALRFSSDIQGNWGINFRRLIKRYNEWNSWNPIDNSISGIVNQSGELSGIREVDPPVRLSFSPYISGYANKHSDANSFDYRINGGMDLQFGITESFTLDMTLIPDFGQVKSDDKVFNISPFEVKYSEQRPFFNEGMDLFEKGGIFYSRRIGSQPRNYWNAEDSLEENEVISSNPNETSMINATKITGRTSNGLGIGFLNALTSSTNAIIRDTITKQEREYLTQGFTNYNMMVFDQTLRNNSFISIVNTNLVTPKQDYMANVTGTDFIFRDKDNRYALSGKGVVSQVNDDSLDVGYKHQLRFDKTSGSFLYNVWSNTESKNYNPNDMGYLQRANEFNNGVSLGYRIYKPFWRLLNWSSWVGVSYRMQHDPMVYSSSHMYLSLRTTFAKSYHYVRADFWMDPRETHDYHEPRVDGRMVIKPRRFSGSIMTSSDYRKPLAIDIRAGYWKAESMDQYDYHASISPRIRFSNSFLLVYQIRQDYTYNDIGYVARSDDNTNVYMGMRDVSTLTNTLDLLYSFNAYSFINFRARHYWRWIDYTSYHELNQDGTLDQPIPDFGNYDVNVNLFNIDLSYQWNFAPGSFLSIVWKNSIESADTDVRGAFSNNFTGLFNVEQGNSLSFRVLYYLDYNAIAGLKRKK